MKKTQHGGARSGSGAKQKLVDPVRRVIIFESTQFKKLARRVKAKKGNYSSVIRELIDEYL